MSDDVWPRRRDVRGMCEEMLHVLLAHYDDVHANYGDADDGFDRYFLTVVRDLMREGVPFQDAVGAFAPECEDDPAAMDEDDRSDLFADLEAAYPATMGVNSHDDYFPY